MEPAVISTTTRAVKGCGAFVEYDGMVIMIRRDSDVATRFPYRFHRRDYRHPLTRERG